MQGGMLLLSGNRRQENSSQLLSFAGKVRKALTTVQGGPATGFKPSPQFLKKSLPLPGYFFS
jgi:hypothetical protein